MGDFAQDTSIEAKGDGSYRAQLSRDWQIWGPNGGYVAAIALRAAGAATSLPRPLTFACHFLSVADFDAVDMQVVALRQAKRVVSLRVSMHQGDRAILEAIAWFGTIGEGFEREAAVMPAVPPPHDLKTYEELIPLEEQAQRHAFWKNFEARPPHWIPWSARTGGPPMLREWYRFRPRAIFDDPVVDAARSLLLIDTHIWPAHCRGYRHDHPDLARYLAPSLDVTAHFHQFAPQSDWLLVDAEAPIATAGFIGGRSRIWSLDGRLLASGTSQLMARSASR